MLLMACFECGFGFFKAVSDTIMWNWSEVG